jgi:hypothetical protein
MRMLLATSVLLIAIVPTVRAAPSPLCQLCDRSASPTQDHGGLVFARGGGMGGGMGGMMRPQATGMGGAPSGGGMNAGTGGGIGPIGGGMAPQGGGIPLGGGTTPRETNCPQSRLRPKSSPAGQNLFSWLSPCGAKF